MDIGTTAADNSTNSAPSRSDRSFSKLTGDLNNFLTLLTTQLQFQDPLSPLDTHEFTNQLVLFSGVEQQIQQNQNLEQLITLQKNGVALGAVDYIGKDIEASGRTTMLQDGAAKFAYLLPEEANAASLRIFDSSGSLVFHKPVDTAEGVHDFTWDGRADDGELLPDGEYSFEVIAVNKDDQPIKVGHSVFGKVSSVQFDNGNALLSIGTVLVPLANVTAVDEPA